MPIYEIIGKRIVKERRLIEGTDVNKAIAEFRKELEPDELVVYSARPIEPGEING